MFSLLNMPLGSLWDLKPPHKTSRLEYFATLNCQWVFMFMSMNECSSFELYRLLYMPVQKYTFWTKCSTWGGIKQSQKLLQFIQWVFLNISAKFYSNQLPCCWTILLVSHQGTLISENKKNVPIDVGILHRIRNKNGSFWWGYRISEGILKVIGFILWEIWTSLRNIWNNYHNGSKWWTNW